MQRFLTRTTNRTLKMKNENFFKEQSEYYIFISIFRFFRININNQISDKPANEALLKILPIDIAGGRAN